MKKPEMDGDVRFLKRRRGFAYAMCLAAFLFFFTSLQEGALHMLAGLICCIALVVGTLLRLRGETDAFRRREIVLSSMRLALLFYLYALAILLFFGRVDGSTTLAARQSYRDANLDTQLNLTFFRTVRRYSDTLRRGVIPKTSMRNLFGNVGLLMPLALLLPAAEKRYQRFVPYLLVTLALLILIEGGQFVLAVGICDVDDVLLNLLGSLAAYGILSIPPLKRLLVHLHLWDE